MDGENMSNYNRQGRSRDMCVGAYARRWRVLNWSCVGLFLNMPFVRHAAEAKYERRMREM